MSETPTPNVRKLGLFCLVVVVLALAAAIPLGCFVVALRVGGGSLLAGAGLGTALALVTRTRRPWLIYLALALGALTFLPFYFDWPPGDAWDVHPWHGAPPLAYSYLDMLRTLLYLVGIPWPFARFGHHAPDPIPSAPALAEDPKDE
ncbi:MAG: hypothetical protein JWL77_2697 [Chthonomonadaceae bacterium]|nr:hypothetical protein [Chthonomonadaceae bacterium]